MLDEMIKFSPDGFYYAFEPLPNFFKDLNSRFKENENIKIYDVALSETTGEGFFSMLLETPVIVDLSNVNMKVIMKLSSRFL